jgi:uncharacterized protein YndB with AHSA1/START domain
MSDLRTAASTTINAPIQEVWRALTTPALIKQWFFGVDTETDWKVGSPLVHRGAYQGRPYQDKGEITRFDPPRVLAHTHWSDRSGKPDRPEHYQQVTWTLSPHDGATELTITETNLPSEEAKAVSETSWKTVLDNLKRLLEHQAT